MSIVNEDIYRKYLAGLLAGNRRSCSEIVQSLLDDNVDVRELYTGLFQRSMYEVGEMWEFNKISVAVEHLATAITESLLNMAYPLIFAQEYLDKSAVIACVANEYHQIGGRMVADTFELKGWHAYFVGASTPLADMVRLVDEKQPDIVGLSLAIYPNIGKLQEALDVVTTTFSKVRVLAGGQAFRFGGTDLVNGYRNAECVRSLTELDDIIAEM